MEFGKGPFGYEALTGKYSKYSGQKGKNTVFPIPEEFSDILHIINLMDSGMSVRQIRKKILKGEIEWGGTIENPIQKFQMKLNRLIKKFY